MRFHVAKIGVFSALLVGGLVACGKDDETDTSSGTEDCTNGMDDDGDGDVDTQDSDCSSGGEEETVCDDGEDDDGDGDVDCDDDDCEFEDACVESDCGNGTDDDGDGDVDCDDRDCNGEDECEVFEPVYFGVDGGFGYDDTTGEIVPAYADGTAIPPYLVVTFMSQEYFDSNYDEIYTCVVAFTYAGSASLPLEVLTDTNYGVSHGGYTFDVTDTDWTVETNCTAEDGYRLDPDGPLGTDDAIAYVTGSFTNLGVGVGQTSSDIQDAIDGAGLGEDAVYFGGGGSALADSTGTFYNAISYTLGFAVDDSMNLLVEGDSNVLILASDYAEASGVPVRGYYETHALYLYGPL
jgi:hypothetical protein